MSQRTIAIGDIHGCARALEAILQAIDLQPQDFLITLGDYIDRGSDSRAVVDLLLEIRERCHLIPLMGNHELMLLTAIGQPSELPFWLQCGGAATLASYGGNLHGIPDSHIDFFNDCHPHFESTEHFFVHANYQHDRPLNRQPTYVRYWEHLSSHTPAPHISGKKAVVGHTPQTSGEPLDVGHLICIDTFCVGGKWLTAYDVTNEQFWQANRWGELR
jgi:serine/threonine protein phosphatase 1